MRKFNMSITALLLVACSSGSPAASPSASPTQPEAVATGGCGSTSVFKGNVPAWLEDAGGHNNPDFLPYVLAVPQQSAAGFLFGYPLRAGHPQNPSNKILWVVGMPRDGAPLQITGHPLGATAPTVATTWPANAGPGEIYPSGVDVPRAGCWHFDLSWAGHQASVDLMYE